jgi:hypothetical protein
MKMVSGAFAGRSASTDQTVLRSFQNNRGYIDIYCRAVGCRASRLHRIGHIYYHPQLVTGPI